MGKVIDEIQFLYDKLTSIVRRSMQSLNPNEIEALENQEFAARSKLEHDIKEKAHAAERLEIQEKKVKANQKRLKVST